MTTFLSVNMHIFILMHSGGEKLAKILCFSVQMSLPSMIIKLTLGFLWCIIHLAISLLSLCSLLIFNLECCLISSGLLWKYWNLQLVKLKYLAIVVDSREAKNTVKINQLLCWLKTLGVKYVCLYDIDGKTLSSLF
uniref:ditrans,polycis-polyprenyl diphosphate synthase [(2E,6E)-farnesyldiphosphate specific] n=1 Tax=Hordeum vulgare subsp. vulgare TaxID=112509 RepID=F2DKL8_HORVV|nr:predicted protein [Hordeum vulgare subsp. vulgare]